MEEIILAKDIDDCSVCPLHGNDCCGGWTSGGGGMPIEPPCCSWDDDTEVYEGMYYYEPSEQEIKRCKEDMERKEKETAERKEREIKEEALFQLKKWSKYPNAQTKDGGELTTLCLCPRCHNWVRDDWSYKDGLIFKMHCPICSEAIGYSYYLD